MAKIEKSVLISASAEKVFALIEQLEAIPGFSSAISEVTCESDGTSTWKIETDRIAFEWRAELLEKKAPSRLSWRSISGLKNNGGYELEEINGRTKVYFFMEYQLPSRLLERVAHTVIDRMIEDVYSEILANIKNEVEKQPGKPTESD